jgi:hypothetical protein
MTSHLRRAATTAVQARIISYAHGSTTESGCASPPGCRSFLEVRALVEARLPRVSLSTILRGPTGVHFELDSTFRLAPPHPAKKIKTHQRASLSQREHHCGFAHKLRRSNAANIHDGPEHGRAIHFDTLPPCRGRSSIGPESEHCGHRARGPGRSAGLSVTRCGHRCIAAN